MLSILKSKLAQLLGAVLFALSILWGVFQAGRKDQREDDRVEDMEKYIETKENIDDVETSPDRDSALKRLRDNGWTG